MLCQKEILALSPPLTITWLEPSKYSAKLELREMWSKSKSKSEYLSGPNLARTFAKWDGGWLCGRWTGTSVGETTSCLVEKRAGWQISPVFSLISVKAEVGTLDLSGGTKGLMKIWVSRKWKRRSRSRRYRDLCSLKFSGFSSIWKLWNTRFGGLVLNLDKFTSLSRSKFLLVFRIFSEFVRLILLNCSPASRTFIGKADQLKVSATLQDRPRVDCCRAFICLINPNKPHIFWKLNSSRLWLILLKISKS